jgi:uncharacterized repeat protein (TIGR03803 family)
MKTARHLVALLLAGVATARAGIVTFEAESGVLGTNFLVGNNSGVIYISNTNNNTASTPGIPGRVATYTVTFPAPRTYDLYAHILVGPAGASDDSFLYGNGFGVKSPTNTGDWILCNNLANAGYNVPTDVVAGGGTVSSGAWKWIDVSQFNGGQVPISFTVTAGNLTQTFLIGGREDGLNLDKFAFGSAGISFTVSNLDNGTLPASTTLTNIFSGPDGNALHRFNPLTGGVNPDGANPAAGLALSGGVLVGTTLNGGLQGAGTVFWMSPDGTNFTAFRSFTNAPDAGNPQGELSFSGTRFFSTTFGGGSSGVGGVIAGQTNGSVSVLKSFAAVSADNATNSGGASPNAALANSGAMLFGANTAGGAAANGTIFSLTTNGATFSILHDFSTLDCQTGTNTDGASPQGGLILSGGTLFGVAAGGGAGSGGVVYSIGTNGANFTTLHSFASLDVDAGTNADGAMPLGRLVLSNSMLYGTTSAGGSGGEGTIFSVQTNGGGFAVLHHFTAVDSVTKTNTDGASPCAVLLLSSNVLYGTASAGGAGAAGTVFSLNLDSAQFYTLRSFGALAGNGTNADGAFPVAPVTRVGNSLYGAAFAGGPGAVGTVFSVVIPPPPAIITSIVNNANGTVTLYFLGGANTTNVIQTTSSLAPPVTWVDVSTNVADANGNWRFTGNAIDTTRFYHSYAR